MIKDFSIREKDYLAVVVIVGLILIFFQIYEDGFWGDECLYVGIAKNIVQTGNWLSLRCYWGPFLDHGPLSLWFIAAGFKIFGVGGFGARFFNGVFGLSMLVMMFLFIKRIASPRIAVIASLVVCFNGNFLRHSSGAMLDIPMVFFITLGLYSVILAVKEKPEYFLLFGVAGALSFLAKDVVTVFLLVPVLVYLVIFSPKSLINKYFILGMILYLALPLLWLIPQHFYAEKSFLDVYFKRQISNNAVPRMFTGSGLLRYAVKLIKNDFPILLTGIAGMIICLKKKKKEFILLAIYLLPVLIIYTLVKLGEDRYYLYLYPALGLFAALFLDRILKGERLDKTIKVMLIVILVLNFTLSVVPIRRRLLRAREFIVFKRLIRDNISGDAELISYGACYDSWGVKRKADYYLDMDVIMVKDENILKLEMDRKDMTRFAVINRDDYYNLSEDFRGKYRPMLESHGKLFIPNGGLKDKYISINSF